MRPRAGALALLVSLLSLVTAHASCSQTAGSSRPAVPSLRADTARTPVIEWARLPLEDVPADLRDSVRFGYLEVPEDHANPAGPTLRLAILVVPAPATHRLPDPVVVMLGGPGIPAIQEHMRVRQEGPHRFDGFRERRDLIILDPRGHGYSDPKRCGELDGREPLNEGSATAERIWLARLASCRAKLTAEAVRLETLSSVQAAHDLEWLRRAMAAPQLNLMGMSYGSRTAAEALRQVPASIRAVYFWGPVPAGRFALEKRGDEAEEVLATLFQRCAAQAGCRAAYPRLKAEYDSVIARLQREPVRIPMQRSDVAPEGELIVDADLMREGLAQVLINRELAAGAPLLIHALANRSLRPAGTMAQQLMQRIDQAGVAAGTGLAFWCNDGVVDRASSAQWRQRCRTWVGEGWNQEGTQPLRSEVPSLIEAGEFDPRTPPSYARFLAAGLSSSHVLITPWHGHEKQTDCSMRIVRQFFDAPARAPDASCMDSIPPIRFVGRVIASRWVGTTVGTVASRPWLAALPGATALMLLVSAVALPIWRWRVRRRGLRNAGGHQFVWLLAVAVLALTLLLGLGAALTFSMREHFFIPLIGLTPGWAWLLPAPWLLLLLVPVAAVLTRPGRSDGVTTPPRLLRWATLGGGALVVVLWASVQLA